MDNIVLTPVPMEQLINSFRQVVKEEIRAAGEKELLEKFFSPKEACKLFQPAITRQTLDAIAKQNGVLKKHYLGGKVFYKYSELIGAIKNYKRYQKKGDPV